MTLFRNKYRIESTGLREWDYSNNAWYYVTICTKNKRCFFGEVNDEEIILSSVGQIVKEEWQRIKDIRNNVDLDEWIIMPNHLHGIIIIGNIKVETHGHASLQVRQKLSNIIRGFKSSATNKIHQAGESNFSWQPRFYYHIIRNEKSLNIIREYIHFNCSKWNEDEENPNH